MINNNHQSIKIIIYLFVLSSYSFRTTSHQCLVTFLLYPLTYVQGMGCSLPSYLGLMNKTSAKQGESFCKACHGLQGNYFSFVFRLITTQILFNERLNKVLQNIPINCDFLQDQSGECVLKMKTRQVLKNTGCPWDHLLLLPREHNAYKNWREQCKLKGIFYQGCGNR